MGLTVLGISGGHDANWCVWRDGQILGAFEKERFTRRRHDTGAVEPLIGPSLRYLGLEAADIDVLATSEPVALGQTPGHTVIAGRRCERLNDWQWQVARRLGRMIPCLSVPHHLAHAAYARYTSPFAALNGYLTTAIAREAGFAGTSVPPAVNDGGIAVGAALLAAYH